MRLAVSFLVALLLIGPVAAAAQTSGSANPLPPAASTEASADVTQTTATVRGRVAANGDETRVRFEYGTGTDYGLTTATQTLPAAAGATDVQAALDRLTPGTTYHYRVLATNDAGIARGADRTLRTASVPSPPGVVTDRAKEVTVDGATVQARVDPNRAATTYVFEYGMTTSYGGTTPVADAGEGGLRVPVEARIGALSSDTRYHFRVRATNANGTVTGSDRTFRTSKLPLAVAMSLAPRAVRYGRTLTVTGTVTGTDRRGVAFTLERRNFPFTTGFFAYGNERRTDSSGVVRFFVPPFTLASQFRLRASGRGLVSVAVTARVQPRVRLRARRLRDGRVQLYGTVSPANASGRVAVQRRLSDGRYVTVRRVALRRAGNVSRFTALLRERSITTTYRAATLLAGGELNEGRSQVVRLRGS